MTRPTPARRQTIYYTVFLFTWTILSMILAQFIIGLPMIWICGPKFSTPAITGLYYALTYILSVCLIIFVPPRLWQLYQNRRQAKPSKSQKPALNPLETSPAELGISQLPTLVDLGLAPIGYFVYAMLANALLNIMQFFPCFDVSEAQEVGFTAGYLSGSGKIIAVISLVIIAPIAEEIIMRGWLYGKLRSRLKIWSAILLTSLAFALLHGQWNVAVGTFVLSAVLCGLREITGTIWSGVLLHMLSNGIAFYLLYIAF